MATNGEELGLMYKRWTLDCVVELAYAVSGDFSNRPELYQDGDVPAIDLADLQGHYGFDPNFPNGEMRASLMSPIFGASDGQGNGNDGSTFQQYREPVLVAAAGFAEESKATSDEFHRERIRSASIPFKTHLVDLVGASLFKTRDRTQAIFGFAESILRAQKVAEVFGINREIDAAWPLKSTDPQGAKLIEKVSTQLAPLSFGMITREMFVRMQRIAEKGSQSIQTIVDNDIEDPGFPAKELTTLIAQLYAWGSDLGLIGGALPQREVPRPQVNKSAMTPAMRSA